MANFSTFFLIITSKIANNIASLTNLKDVNFLGSIIPSDCKFLEYEVIDKVFYCANIDNKRYFESDEK